MAGPAEEVTLDNPSWALEAYSEAVEEALEVACFAVSVAFDVVVDSNRRAAMRLQAPDCRSMGRAREEDILTRRIVTSKFLQLTGWVEKEVGGFESVGGEWLSLRVC